MSYNNQKSWKEIQSFLPQNLHFTSTYKPDEEWWNWKGNKVHLEIKMPKQKLFYFMEWELMVGRCQQLLVAHFLKMALR